MARVQVAELIYRERVIQADRVAKLCERKGKPRRTPPGKLHDAMREMVKSGDWSAATHRHLVALYVWLHEKAYGVESELAFAARSKPAKNALFGAEAAAKRMLEQEFRGDAGAMAAYVRWWWMRERQREERAKQSGADRGRTGWQLMFSSRSLLQDYRLAIRRTATG